MTAGLIFLQWMIESVRDKVSIPILVDANDGFGAAVEVMIITPCAISLIQQRKIRRAWK